MSKIPSFHHFKVNLFRSRQLIRSKKGSQCISNINSPQASCFSSGSGRTMHEAVRLKCEIIETSDRVEDLLIVPNKEERHEIVNIPQPIEILPNSKNFNPWKSLLKNFKFYKSRIPSPDYIKNTILKKPLMPSKINVTPKLSTRSIRELANAQKTIYCFWKSTTLTKKMMFNTLKSDPTQFVSIIEHLIKDQATAVAMVIYFDLVMHYYDTNSDLVYQCYSLLEDLLLDGHNLKHKMQSADIIWDYFQFITHDSYNPHTSLHISGTQKLFELDLVKLTTDSLPSEITAPHKMTSLFNQLIHRMKGMGRHKAVCSLYDLMERRGINPDIITLTSCMDSCIDFNDNDRFKSFFKTLKSSFNVRKVQTPTYTVLLKSLLKLDLDRDSRYEVFYYVKNARWNPNTITAMEIFPLMRKYKNGKIHDYLNYNLLPKLNHNHPYVRNVKFNHELITNPVEFDTLEDTQHKMFDRLIKLDPYKAEMFIIHLCDHQRAYIPNNLFNGYRMHHSNEYIPSVKVITKLIHTNLIQGHQHKADKYIELLAKLGHTPTHHTHYAILHGLNSTQGVRIPKNAYQRLVDKGYQPNSMIYGLMTSICLKAALITPATYFFQQFFQNNMIPTTFTYNIFLKYSLDNRFPDFTGVLINSMTTNNVKFNSYTYDVLIKGYYKNEIYFRSSYFYGKLLYSGLPINPSTTDFIQKYYYLFSQVDKNFENYKINKLEDREDKEKQNKDEKGNLKLLPFE